MKYAAILTLLSLCAACATPEATERHRQTCSSYGHAPGSTGMAACVEGKSKAGGATANRIGTSVLTNVLIGAI